MKLRIQLIDQRVKQHPRSYLFQSLFATLVLFLVLFVEDAPHRGAIIAAIGSTTFVLFIMPGSATASTRHVLGGHFIGLSVGAAIAAVDSTGMGQHLLADMPVVLNVEAAFAVGLTMLGMASTNTEHAPAAGTALGMAMHTFSWSLVLFVVSSVVALSLAHRLLRPWLRDLL